MKDRFQEMRLFVRAAETGSFSAAGRELGLSQPSVSRIVSELEARLGVRLLLRTTRKVVPTEAGLAYLNKARQILVELDEADDIARGADSLHGLLRVAVSSTLLVRSILPALPGFVPNHPKLRLEFLAADFMHDLVAESVDVAIRFGALPDSTFGVRKLATLQRVLLAAPAYLAARGTPRQPADLAGHDCIFGPSGNPAAPWEFERDGAATSVKIEPRYLFTSADALIACAAAGMGIVRASALMCRAELDSGALQPLLPDYALAPVAVHAVFPAGRVPSQKVRLFSDFLTGSLAGPAGWSSNCYDSGRFGLE